MIEKSIKILFSVLLLLFRQMEFYRWIYRVEDYVFDASEHQIAAQVRVEYRTVSSSFVPFHFVH